MATPEFAKPSEEHHYRSHVYKYSSLGDEALAKQLAADAAWAAELIEKLTHIGGDESMKPGIVNACEGLAFVRASKGGLGVTMARGNGFVIRKLDQDRTGNSRWSAPVYFFVSQMGIGLSAGYETSESVLALMATSSVMHFAVDHSVMGTDLGLMSTEGAMTGVPAGTFGRNSHMDVQADNTSASFCYSLSQGLLANVSITGTGTHPDKAVNDKLYGEGTPITDVLQGKTDTFQELQVLYRQIAATGRKALE
ncbi:hypothetical protein CHLRE_06g264050v5 [Chlamydomonas reinhardtii]|uniref:Ysc84 actin-binding domain-containing protein n=1 Tax=Chlamydomonas reinhardtii TaxID=3055 RepID=A8HX11_CHLRE|nr:uncharacterized protein CHLRE_06g264050v5 [Chlamydomonas reinhardtii]PNW81874.1 hypothetical protein CHLRE_06g264050v5 [Chlamydomonas reinhardtii]|eukprot:XP_001696562.1 predicted protein [Chlamydomonas reinhardtii]